MVYQVCFLAHERASPLATLPGAGAPIILTPTAIHDIAVTIYTNAHTFSAVGDDYSRIMVQCGFANFTPSSRKAIANDQLDLSYNKVKIEARATWLSEEYIDTVIDECTDVLGGHIVNLLFVT